MEVGLPIMAGVRVAADAGVDPGTDVGGFVAGKGARAGADVAVGAGIGVGADWPHPTPMAASRGRRPKIKHRFKVISFPATGFIIW